MKFTTVRHQLACVVFILILMACKAPAASVTVNSSSDIGGTTSGSGTYPVGTTIVLTATATNACWTFAGWSDGSTNNPYSVTVASDASYTAYFVMNSNLITAASSPTNGGTTSGGGWYLCGSAVTLTAIPNACWTFTNWSDGSIDNPHIITNSSDSNYTANFIPAGNLTITTASSPMTGGTTTGDTTTNCGSTVTLTATPTNACWTFAGWSDGSTDNPHSITVSSDTNLTANFVQKSFSIQTGVAPANSGTTTGNTTANCGESVTVTATAAAGYKFVDWTRNIIITPFGGPPHLVRVTVSTLAQYTFTIGGNQVLTANFLYTNNPCQFSISPTMSAVIPVTGGGGTVDVSTSAGCDWTYTNPYYWIQITNVTSSSLKFWVKPLPATHVPGTAATIVSYPVVPFILQIAGRPFTVRQTVEVIAHTPIPTNLPEH